jgi:NADH-quinone oxidoreductase subunit C
MRTNGNSPGARFIETQGKVNKALEEKYAEGRKLELDKLDEPILWAKNATDAKALVGLFMKDPSIAIDFLSDVTAYENKDEEDGEKRFILVYQLSSTTLHTRVRIKAQIGLTEQAMTITDLFIGANWLEREVYDMYGITFQGHPNMRRIMMDERFSGFPLRKEYPMKQRENFTTNIPFHLGANPLEVGTENSTDDGKKTI